MGGATVNLVFVNPFGAFVGLNLHHLFNPLHLRLRRSVMKQPKYSGHPNYWASFEREFLLWLHTERLYKDLWILGLMHCFTGKLKDFTYNLYVERQYKGNPLRYEELWRALKKKGSRPPGDRYRDQFENSRGPPGRSRVSKACQRQRRP